MSRPAGRLQRPALLRILGTGLSVALLIYLLARQGWSEIVDAVDLFGPADEHLHVFDYTDPPNLPLALTCAALSANLHAKENADAR